jgi:two-component system, NarL family, nitrate/nitrite response regulator NarL
VTNPGSRLRKSDIGRKTGCKTLLKPSKALRWRGMIAKDYFMKLLLIDDHPVVRQGLSALLEQNLDGTAVLLARSCEEALSLVVFHPDLDAVFLDLMMPGINGFDALKLFGDQYPALPVIVLSSSEDPIDVRRALAHGALGYVPKSASPQTILAALRLVLCGEIYVPPLVLLGAAGASGPGENKTSGGRIAELTARQKEVLVLLTRGMQNKEIGEILGLADKTVKTHVTAIFRTLHVINRTQAASLAREANLV